MHIIDGFDYTTGKAVQLTRAQWRDKIRAVIETGGRRRVDHGETFLHGKNARITAEIYANLSEKS